ncbi:MAG: LOG family protein [Armatimonadetes bacterium]|nr:LOG family protein [Armatimonadota bacterium]
MFQRLRDAWSNLCNLQKLFYGSPAFRAVGNSVAGYLTRPSPSAWELFYKEDEQPSSNGSVSTLGHQPSAQSWTRLHFHRDLPSHDGDFEPLTSRAEPIYSHRIGVLGSTATEFSPSVADACFRLGKAVARSEACLLTGACPGLPHLVVLGAKAEGGHVIGISPATRLREHAGKYESPFKEYDAMVYTGLGVSGSELITIRSSDIVILVGGRSDTPNEFAAAYQEGKLIGVLMGVDGHTASLPKLEPHLDKTTGAHVLYDGVPERLVERLIAQREIGESLFVSSPRK